MSNVKNDKQEEKVFTREGVKLDFAQLASLIIKDLNVSNSTTYRSYTRDNVATYLANPLRYGKELQSISTYLYNFSPHYRRVINYFAKMPTLDFYIEPYGLDLSKSINEKSLRNNYNKAVDAVELMNIRHEYGKALVSAWKLGTFYGYEISTKDSYLIMELPYQYCQISGIMDGVMTFNFDMSYFDKNAPQLEMYPKEFKSMYNSYKSGSKPRWQEVDPAKSVCIKINEDVYYDIPPFAGVFFDIFDLEDYKTLRKTSTLLGNYKFLIEKIPIRDKSDKNNDFLVDLKTVGMFHNKTASLLPEEIGIFSTPFDIETVEFSKDKTERDSVKEAEESLYSGMGTSQLLFSGSKSSQANLAKSINVDESEVFLILRQIERIISVKVKNAVKGTFKFRVRVLDNTIFNKKENIEMLLKNAQFGMPVKTALGASLGLSPSAFTSMAYFENVVLGLAENLVPLSSSHTQSGQDTSGNDSTDKGGRPEKNPDDLSEKGEEGKERGDNDNRE